MCLSTLVARMALEASDNLDDDDGVVICLLTLSAMLSKMAWICLGVLPWPKTASGKPAREARWWSRLAKEERISSGDGGWGGSLNAMGVLAKLRLLGEDDEMSSEDGDDGLAVLVATTSGKVERTNCTGRQECRAMVERDNIVLGQFDADILLFIVSFDVNWSM